MMGWAGAKTKKELKAFVGHEPQFVETSLFGPEYVGDGTYTIVGPDPYQSRKWYAVVTVVGGLVKSVQ